MSPSIYWRADYGALEMTFIGEDPSLACYCEEPARATPVLSEAEGSQSPIKKR